MHILDLLKFGITLLCASLFTINVMAQYSLKEADREFERLNYSIAVKKYEKAFTSKPSVRAVQGIAESYLQMRNYQLAEPWYGRLVTMPDALADSHIRYAEVLKNNGKYTEAKKQYEYLRDNHFPGVDPSAIKEMIRSCDSAVFWMNHPIDIQLRNLSAVNSTFSDWGAVPFSGGLLFLSDRLGKGFDSKKYGWTGNGYTHLFITNEGSAIRPLDTDNINGVFHTGLVALSADASEMVTSKTNNAVQREDGSGNRHVNLVGFSLYSSRFNNGKWMPVAPMSFGAAAKGSSIGDPFLTKDGKFLYFSSDMPGGYGGTDIYYAERLSDGSWSTPRNIGPTVNTKGQERCPAFDESGNFYFASDGLIGMGGLDIYVVKGGNFAKAVPQNIGYPVNSPEDDFAFRFKDSSQGYLSSNRQGGKGNDDIYSFQMPSSAAVAPSFIKLSGRVVSRKTLMPVAGAVVTLTDGSRDDRRQILTGDNGEFNFRLDTSSTYQLKAEKTGFLRDRGTYVDVARQHEMDSIFVVVKLDSVILNKPQKLFGQIENIYFNYDKWDLKPEMRQEVDKLASILQEQPTLKVEISAYTDSRGKAAYNMRLSQKRAQSVVDYLRTKGIDENRLEARGYGESKLVNGCRDGVPCTEQEHFQNRRVEFTLFER